MRSANDQHNLATAALCVVASFGFTGQITVMICNNNNNINNIIIIIIIIIIIKLYTFYKNYGSQLVKEIYTLKYKYSHPFKLIKNVLETRKSEK